MKNLDDETMAAQFVEVYFYFGPRRCDSEAYKIRLHFLMGKRNKLRVFLIKQCLLVTIFLIIILYSVYPTKYRINFWMFEPQVPKAILYPNLIKSAKDQNRNKLILYWNTFFGEKDMFFGNGSDIFKNCPISNCYATSNREFTSVENFDAIIIHAPSYLSKTDGFPVKRSVHQKYIFFSMESPFHTKFDFDTKEFFFNLTMTYRLDSDIPRPYGIIVANETNYQLPSVEEIKNKKKKVAWFVSNCYANRRFEYALELSKYIPVDIYGKCGKFNCEDRTKCYQMLEQDYKFYLSFENSLCKEYVTEKVYNVLNYNVIPIVLGLFSYNNSVPPNSVINTWDFNSPKDLAEYLWELDANPEKYMKYFEWKKHFSVHLTTQYTLCRMCEVLNRPIVYSWYENIKNWFYGFHCVE